MGIWQNIQLDAKSTNRVERKAAKSIYRSNRSIGWPEKGRVVHSVVKWPRYYSWPGQSIAFDVTNERGPIQGCYTAKLLCRLVD
jgi:hypothetical protein